MSSVIFTPNASPASCQAITGQYPLTEHVSAVWEYRPYQTVMPPYKRKQIQSFQCGAEKGTFYYFEYASGAQKDRAVLFAKPILAKPSGGHGASIREWANGFVIISFADPSPELLHALDDRLAGNSTTPASPPPLATPLKSAPATMTAPPSMPASQPIQKKVIPQTPSVIQKTPAIAVVPASTPAKVETSTIVVEPSGEPFAQMKPAIAADPFAGSPTSKPMEAARPAPPPPAPVPTRVTIPQPRHEVAEPVHERHVTPKSAPSVSPPLAKPTPAPAFGTADLSSSVLESYASKMGCESPDRNAQTQLVCGFMQEFASGLPPELPFKSSAILIGPVYTIDSNGRFTDLHYDALTGSSDPNTVGFFALPSTGGKDDFEIKQLVEARKAKTPLPQNEALTRLSTVSAEKRMGLLKTATRSAVIQPTPDRRVFIRRANDHLVLIGISGETPERQKNSSLVVIVLY